jgi:ribosomal protein S18 acetylase RimI-like enzyme
VTGARIRLGAAGDVAGILELWRLAGAVPSATDSSEALAVLLAVDPDALLVAETGGRLVGSIIAAWNGWRGSFYRLAVHPAHRRRGIGTALLREGEGRLRRRGAVRLDAVVAADGPDALAFWEAMGYERQANRSRFVRTS